MSTLRSIFQFNFHINILMISRVNYLANVQLSISTSYIDTSNYGIHFRRIIMIKISEKRYLANSLMPLCIMLDTRQVTRVGWTIRTTQPRLSFLGFIYTVSNTSDDVYIYTPHGRGGGCESRAPLPSRGYPVWKRFPSPSLPSRIRSRSLSLSLLLVSLTVLLDRIARTSSSAPPPSTSFFFHSTATARPQWVDEQPHSIESFTLREIQRSPWWDFSSTDPHSVCSRNSRPFIRQNPFCDRARLY